jgi:hypothetical protein
MAPADWILTLRGGNIRPLGMLLWRNARIERARFSLNMRQTMKRNSKLTLVGIIILLASGVFAETQAPATNPGPHKVIAYYFHTNTRCSTCIKIEQYSHEAIEQGFPNELKNGALEVRVVNYEQPENRHFIQDYKLVSKSLVLVNVVNGKQTKWTNLKLVWQLTGHKDAFLNYVRKEVREYLSSM